MKEKKCPQSIAYLASGLSASRLSASRLAKLACSTLGLALLLLPLALPSAAAYKRPRDARPPNTATSTSGARDGGVVASNGLQLTLLAPQQHVGQSQSLYPTFEWFVPVDGALPGEFQLYEIQESEEEPEAPNVLFQRVLETPHEFISEQGFMSFTLPAELPGLKLNTNYIWQVLLRYGPRPSDVVIVRSQIEIVSSESSSSERSASDTATASTGEPIALSPTAVQARIQQLAESGLWYDALALTAELSAEDARRQREDLLLALAQMESSGVNINESQPNSDSDAAADNATVLSHAEALRQIVDWDARNMSLFTANRQPS